MNKTDKIMYFNKKSVAYYSGLYGLEIKDIIYDINDYVVFTVNAWYGKNSYKDVHKAKIYYSNSNSKGAYLRYHGYTIPLNECIRTNIF